MLAFAVTRLTGNIDLMRAMDWLGRGVSYTPIAEIDTEMCLQKLEESQTGVALPRNIYQGVFIALAWDNIDRGDDQWRGHTAPGQWHGCAAHNHRTNATT